METSPADDAEVSASGAGRRLHPTAKLADVMKSIWAINRAPSHTSMA
jgi:hypothetical protein